MLKKKLTTLAVAIGITLSISIPAFASHIESETTMENAGAYLFDWRSIDCGNGRYFAIITGGDTLYESNVILERGYGESRKIGLYCRRTVNLHCS